MKLSWSPLQPRAQFFCCASLLETMTVLFFAFHTDDPRQRFSDGSLVTRTLIPGSRLIWILTSSEDLRSCSSIYLKQFKKECKWVWMFFFRTDSMVFLEFLCVWQQATGGGGGRIKLFGLVEGNTYRKP